MIALVLAVKGDYRLGFAVLLISALLCLGFPFANRMLYPRPQELERAAPRRQPARFSRGYWLYLAAGALVAAGFVDFALIAFHFQKAGTLATAWIPIYYAVAMGVGMGAQESLLKAIVAGLLPEGKRSTAIGLYDTGFGIAWFAGSALMGLLYSQSLPALVVFSVVVQLAALPVFWAAERRSPGAA